MNKTNATKSADLTDITTETLNAALDVLCEKLPTLPHGSEERAQCLRDIIATNNELMRRG